MSQKILAQFGNRIFIRILVAVMLLSIAIFSLFAFITMNYFFILGGSLALSVAVSFFISFRLTKNLRSLTKFVQQVGVDNNMEQIHINSNDEFQLLGEYINKMVMSMREKQSEARSEEVVMEAIIMNLSDGIVMFNEGGDISLINGTAEKILEAGRGEVLRKNVKDLSPTSNVLRLYEMMGRSIEEGWVDEHLSLWKGGKTKVYPVKASSVVDNDGVFWGFLAIIKNI